MGVTFPASLHPLVQEVEAHAYVRPEASIEAARRLLKQCHVPEHLAYVYEQLGFAHLLLGEHRLSGLFYEQALALEPNSIYALANLAHARYELGHREEAVRIGREALRLKDEEACNSAEVVIPALQAPYHGPVNLIAFSLYGHRSRYGEMAVLNVLAARRHLPDFVCRFYLDHSVPPALVQRLQSLGAQCVDVGPLGLNIPPTFWRFLAMDDAQADCVLVRDVDALIDAREAWCVADWRCLGEPFHILRNDCCHTELILAGLFGIRAGVLRNLAEHMHRFVQALGEAGWKRYADQLFLRRIVWPAVRDHTLTHDTVYGYGERIHALAFRETPSCGPLNAFMGANHATCRVACEHDPAWPPDAAVLLNLHDQAGTLICCHVMERTGAGPSASLSHTEWEAHLPLLYKGPLEQGAWTATLSVQAGSFAGSGAGSIDPVLLGIGGA